MPLVCRGRHPLANTTGFSWIKAFIDTGHDPPTAHCPRQPPPYHQAVKFELIDKVIERSDDRIVAVKTVTKAEEYLQDHFPTYPVLPGVLMIEALVQAGRELLAPLAGNRRLVLGEVKALRYGSFVRPGEALRVEVQLVKQTDGGAYTCKGTGTVVRPGGTNGEPGGEQEMASENAVAGRFTLRPVRTGDNESEASS